jgi:hypothetical protein
MDDEVFKSNKMRASLYSVYALGRRKRARLVSRIGIFLSGIASAQGHLDRNWTCDRSFPTKADQFIDILVIFQI